RRRRSSRPSRWARRNRWLGSSPLVLRIGSSVLPWNDPRLDHPGPRSAGASPVADDFALRRFDSNLTKHRVVRRIDPSGSVSGVRYAWIPRRSRRSVMRWSDLESRQPKLAELGRRRLVEPGVVLVATIRRDGTPRLSPVEPYLMDGDLWLSMLWQS